MGTGAFVGVEVTGTGAAVTPDPNVISKVIVLPAALMFEMVMSSV
jgi:hypothetical protein